MPNHNITARFNDGNITHALPGMNYPQWWSRIEIADNAPVLRR